MKQQYRNRLKGKTILITGGTGSFGTTVVSTLLSAHPSRIIIFSRDELKQFEMRNRFDNNKLKFVIGDVRDPRGVETVMEGVDHVFHAAALKQVPTCEFFPMEAVQTNILGAANVLSAAIKAAVARVVILSTDKAVYPINAMGMTKALMEKVMIAHARNLEEKKPSKTLVCGVRYGNVLYSRGSVIPYFVDLIRTGKPLSVTNGHMTRFLLPLPDAVDLVLYALVRGVNGHIYVRKAPACTMETLAAAMCKIFRHAKGYKEVGVRGGEKVHETLVTEEELMRARDEGKYFDIPPESQGLDYNRYFVTGKRVHVEQVRAYTSENTKRLGIEDTAALLVKLPDIQQAMGELKV